MKLILEDIGVQSAARHLARVLGRNRIWKAIYSLVASVGFLGTRTYGEEFAFIPGDLSTAPVFRHESRTFGNGFNVRLSSPAIKITGIGIFDRDGDGLASAHSAGLWEVDRFGEVILSREWTIAAGTEAELVNGYRYVDIDPITIQPFGRFIVGAVYSGADIDLIQRPVGIVSSSPWISVGFEGLISDTGVNLTMPTLQLSQGQEGLPNYSFYPVNFRFNVIPEPSIGCLFALSIGGMLLATRPKSRRGSDSP